MSSEQPPYRINRVYEDAPNEVMPVSVPRPRPASYVMQETVFPMRSVDHAGVDHEATAELFVYRTAPGTPRNFGFETVTVPQKDAIGSYIAPLALEAAQERRTTKGNQTSVFGNAQTARDYIDAFYAEHGDAVTTGRRNNERDITNDLAAVMGPEQGPYMAESYDALAVLHGTDAETVAELHALDTLNATIQ